MKMKLKAHLDNKDILTAIANHVVKEYGMKDGDVHVDIEWEFTPGKHEAKADVEISYK